MKNITFNYFRNAFALVGFFIIACSVATTDEPTVEPELPVQNNNGKYQASSFGSSQYFVFLNTSTGKLKVMRWYSGEWYDQDGDYTLTH